MAILLAPALGPAAAQFQKRLKAPQNRKSLVFDEDHSFASECERMPSYRLPPAARLEVHPKVGS